jgi:hypothetical protein
LRRDANRLPIVDIQLGQLCGRLIRVIAAAGGYTPAKMSVLHCTERHEMSPWCTPMNDHSQIVSHTPKAGGLVDSKRLLEELFPDSATRLSVRWLRKMTALQRIPFIKLGNRVFFEPAEVRAALDHQFKVLPGGALPRRRRRKPRPPRPVVLPTRPTDLPPSA